MPRPSTTDSARMSATFKVTIYVSPLFTAANAFYFVCKFSIAMRAVIAIYNACITALVAIVYWEINTNITAITSAHMFQNIFNCIKIIYRRCAKLYIADMPSIGVFMVFTLDTHFFVSAYRITNRYMERITVVIFISYPRYLPIFHQERIA